MEAGPVFEDAIGAQFLTQVLTLPSIIKERHDTLEFENHLYIRHNVRLVVAIDRLPDPPDPGHRTPAPYPAWGTNVLRASHGRVVVPLGDLDRHSRATTHITDEADRLVPLFTASELNGFLSSGLVAFAAVLIPDLDERLVEHLRSIPAKAGANPRPAVYNPQDAADAAFEAACKELLDKFDVKGLELLKAFEFRLALAAITSAVQLVIEVDPERGRTRVFSYSFYRPISSAPVEESRTRLRIPWKRPRPIRAFKRLGTTSFQIDLGPVGGCERYQLNAEAPFDTWFASAEMYRGRGRAEASDAAHPFGSHGQGASTSADTSGEQIDTSQRFRINYTRASSSGPWSGVLRVQLRTVYTGVTRASVYASVFLAVGALVGTWHVIEAPKHLLIKENTEAVAALLLLFPGIAASAVAGVARNTLTATMQFPMRLMLWGMSCGSFVLATAAAFGLGGHENVALWVVVTAGICLAAIGLFWRSRTWITRPGRGRSK
jgi:hypothetical protein